MKRHSLLITLLFVFVFSQSYGQNFKARFYDLISKKDTSAQSKLLADWEKTNPDDPELYTAYFNFYVIKSTTEVLDIETTQRGEKSLVLTDPKTHKIAGYINDGGYL